MYNELISLIRDHYQTEEFIPLHAPVFRGKEKEYLIDCIDSTFVSSVGAYVNKFEEMMTEVTGAKYVVATMNGTSALHASLVALGVEKDDEVITQSLTFIATANAISYTGAHPVFVDSSLERVSMDPASLEEFLSDNTTIDDDGFCLNKKTKRRIKACVPMHTFGIPAKIIEICLICEKYRIPVLEDAAESLGSYVDGVHTGNFGLLSAISFNGNKITTTGGGGVIVTHDEGLAKRLKHMTTTAKIPHRWNYDHDMIGFNYRLPNLNAALGCAQLEQLDTFLASKRTLADKYSRFFESNSEVEFVDAPSNVVSNNWLCALRLKSFEKREEFLKITNDNGIMTRPLWTPMHKLDIFKHCQRTPMDNSDYLFQRVVNIPSGVK